MNVLEKINVTISLYFEVKDAEIYGGIESVGYAEIKYDLEKENLSDVKLRDVAKNTISNYAKLFKVPEDNIRVISRTEYEENTED